MGLSYFGVFLISIVCVVAYNHVLDEHAAKMEILPPEPVVSKPEEKPSWEKPSFNNVGQKQSGNYPTIPIPIFPVPEEPAVHVNSSDPADSDIPMGGFGILMLIVSVCLVALTITLIGTSYCFIRDLRRASKELQFATGGGRNRNRQRLDAVCLMMPANYTNYDDLLKNHKRFRGESV